MRLAHRVRQLERLDALARPSSPMERLQRALNESKLRVTGNSSGPANEAVLNDLAETFTKKLSHTELASFIEELERLDGGAPPPK